MLYKFFLYKIYDVYKKKWNNLLSSCCMYFIALSSMEITYAFVTLIYIYLKLLGKVLIYNL